MAREQGSQAMVTSAGGGLDEEEAGHAVSLHREREEKPPSALKIS